VIIGVSTPWTAIVSTKQAEIQERFAAGSFAESVHKARFLLRTHCLAEVMGNLGLSSDGRIVLRMAGPVKFNGPVSLPQREITVEGRLGEDLRFIGNPTNRSGLIDLLIGTNAAEVEFHQLEITGTSNTKSTDRAYGYVDAFPEEILRAPLLVTKQAQLKSFDFHSDISIVKGNVTQHGNLLEIVPQTTEFDNRLIVGASLFALSMIAGYRVSWCCLTTVSANLLNTTLVSKKTRQNNFYAPLCLNSRSAANEVFSLIQAFLCSNPETRIARLLGMLWDYSGSDFDVRALILGVAIEGIANELVVRTPALDAETTEFKSRALGALRDSRTHSSGNALGGLPAKDIDRLEGLVKNFNPAVAKRRIAAAGKVVNYNVSEDQQKAWDAIRNGRGHGDFNWSFPADKEWLNYLSCVDLVNKLWLGAVGIPPEYFRPWANGFELKVGDGKTNL
jgi:hypothetical protein